MQLFGKMTLYITETSKEHREILMGKLTLAPRITPKLQIHLRYIILCRHGYATSYNFNVCVPGE